MAMRIRLSANAVTTIDLETLPDGTQRIVKNSGDTFVLEAEAAMLEHLRAHLRVPEVYEHSRGRLVMEYIPNDALCNGSCETEIADALAHLHSIPAQGVFGFASDTTIGPFRQRNRPRIRWVDFYREMRVLDFAAKAFDEQKLDKTLLGRIEKLSANLEQFLTEPEHSSLLHGDVWSGNVLTKDNHLAAFIDPACYYGHFEMELAFIGMFNTFGESFYSRYREHRRIPEGFFEVRAHLYRLFPYLVHLRAFGSSYLNGIDFILKRVGY